MTTRVITLWREHITSLTMSMRFLIEIIDHFERKKFKFLNGHVINSLTLVVISYEIYITRSMLVSWISNEMTYPDLRHPDIRIKEQGQPK